MKQLPPLHLPQAPCNILPRFLRLLQAGTSLYNTLAVARPPPQFLVLTEGSCCQLFSAGEQISVSGSDLSSAHLSSFRGGGGGVSKGLTSATKVETVLKDPEKPTRIAPNISTGQYPVMLPRCSPACNHHLSFVNLSRGCPPIFSPGLPS